MKLSFPVQVRNLCFYDSEKDWSPPGTLGEDYPSDFESKIGFYQNYLTAFKTKNMFVFPTTEFEESAFAIT